MTLIEIIYAFMFLTVILFSVTLTLQILFYITINKIIMTQDELVQELNAVKDQVSKIGSETTTLKEKVAELEEQLSQAGNATPEVLAALQALKDQAQIVDDLVADEPTEEEV